MATEYQLQLRRDSAADWTSNNPTLASGEPGVETDTGKLKIGDGSTAWTSLAYFTRDTVGGKFVGELFHRAGSVTATSVNFPAVCLDSINDQATYSEANYPDLIDWARDQKTEYIVPGSSPVTDHSVTVSGSNITFPDTDAANAVLAAKAEEALYTDAQQSSPTGSADYTNFVTTVNIAGTDYVITGINLSTRVVTVTGTPATGSQTAIFYPYRVAGSTTTCRLFQSTGMGLMSPGDPDGLFVSGGRRRGYMQGHTFSVSGNTLANNNSVASGANSTAQFTTAGGGTKATIDSDGTNGTPRTGPETHGPAMVAHLYLWTGRYSA